MADHLTNQPHPTPVRTVIWISLTVALVTPLAVGAYLLTPPTPPRRARPLIPTYAI
jgi:hypothetical protein